MEEHINPQDILWGQAVAKFCDLIRSFFSDVVCADVQSKMCSGLQRFLPGVDSPMQHMTSCPHIAANETWCSV